ncbi:MAG: hypothetical protein RQ752_02800, partial [Thermohalobaculum sp.]|nr:hypothetical protein [Thermohalobaculum sp.]
MLRSVWSPANLPARRLMGVALAMLIVARALLAPVLAQSAVPGLVALCAGGALIWVAAEGVAPVDETASRDPCPWLGLGAAAAEPAARLPMRRRAPAP